MASRKTQGRFSFRDLVYSLFANRRVLSVSIVLGALVGFLRAATQERAYFGRVELASAGRAADQSVALPDAVRLRRLVLDPKNLEALTAWGEGDRGRSPPKPPVVALRPVMEDAPTAATVWQLQVDVPAESRQAAVERLTAFVDKVQGAFVESRGTVADRREPAAEPAAAVALKTEGAPEKQSSSLGAARDGQAAPDPARTPSPIGGMESEVLLLEGRIARGELEQADIARAIAERRRVTAELTADPRADWLPVALEADFPDIAALGRRRDSLIERRSALASVVTASHPALRALDRSFAAARERLMAGLAEVQRVYGGQIEALEGQARELEQRIAADRAQLTELAAKLAEALAREDRARQGRDERILEFLTRSAAPGSSSAGAPIAVPSLPPGKLLVAGPFVDASPVRPRQLRDAAMGAVLGLALGLAWIVVRSTLDQRVHVAADVDELDFDLEVFGSIPQLKSAAPVRLAGSREDS